MNLFYESITQEELNKIGIIQCLTLNNQEEDLDFNQCNNIQILKICGARKCCISNLPNHITNLNISFIKFNSNLPICLKFLRIYDITSNNETLEIPNEVQCAYLYGHTYEKIIFARQCKIQYLSISSPTCYCIKYKLKGLAKLQHLQTIVCSEYICEQNKIKLPQSLKLLILDDYTLLHKYLPSNMQVFDISVFNSQFVYMNCCFEILININDEFKVIKRGLPKIIDNSKIKYI